MKKIVCLLFCLLLALTVLSACQPEEHKHTFDTKWQSDENDHWHQATCEHTEEVSEKGAHIDEDENDLCDICGYSMEHAHTFAEAWSYNKDSHYHKNTCGHADDPKYRKDEAAHEDKNNDSLCDVCQYDYDHKHTYADAWTKADDQNHWHAPTCGHDVPGSDKAPHEDLDNNGMCDACGDAGGHEHTYSEEWSNDENDHWRAPTCGHEIDPADKNAHVDEDGDKKCDICQYSPEHFHVFDKENWTSDAEKHWHAATCEHTDMRADEGSHIGYEEDGICDTCEYVVFKKFTVSVSDGSLYSIVDKNAAALSGPFVVKEGETVVFYIAVPTNCRLEKVEGEGVTVDMANPVGPVDIGQKAMYLYKVTVVPTADVTAKVTVNKLSSVEVVMNETVTLTSGNKIGFVDKTITFHLEEPGKYAVYSLKHQDAKFGPAGSGNYEKEYIFTMTGAGDVALDVRWFFWDKNSEVDIDYIVMKVDEKFVLPYLEGSGYTMPSNVYVNITFTLPEKGLYVFTTTAGNLTWFTTADPSGTVEQQFFHATKNNQVFNAQLKLATEGAATYDFDWKIIKVDSNEKVTVGDNKVSVDVSNYTFYKFTATQPGLYLFEHDDSRFMVQSYLNYNGWGEGLYTLSALEMQAGESIILFIGKNIYAQEEAEENFESTLKITYAGYNPGTDGDGNPIMIPNVDTTYSVYEPNDYTFTIPAGTQISFDSGATWENGPVVKKYVDGSIKYRVRNTDGSNEKITVKIDVFTYSFELVAGGEANKVMMIPGKEYVVYLTSAPESMTKNFLLSWTDTNLTVKFGSEELESPATIEGYMTYGSHLTIVYNGTAEAELSFNLEDTTVYEGETVIPEAEATLAIGSNAIETDYDGKVVSFTARIAGNYQLAVAAGESNAFVSVLKGAGDSENVDLPYSFSMKVGETITFLVAAAEGEDTIDLVLSKV